MREQERARAEASGSAAPKSASAKPQAKAMPSRQVEWLIHNSTAVVEEVPVISPYRKQPHRPQTKYWPPRKGEYVLHIIVNLCILSYTYIPIKRNTQSHRKKRLTSPHDQNAIIIGNKCTNDS